jgi:hypothetical protein
VGKATVIDYLAAGKTLTAATEAVSIVAFDATEGSFSESEKTQLVKAYADFCEAQGVIDVPPGLALIIGLGTVFIPRAMSKNGKERLGVFFKKAKTAVLGSHEFGAS